MGEIVADISGFADSVKRVAVSLGELGKSMSGVVSTFKEVRKTVEQERLEKIRKMTLLCHVCGAVMVLKEPKDGDTWSAFFGCSRYHLGCRGGRRITATLEAESDDVEYLWDTYER